MSSLGARWDYARRAADNSVVDGSLMSAEEWRALQATYQVGELHMPCCPGAAVPKLSSNGNHFFAHASGECSSAPESLWHVQAKESVRDAARQLGYAAALEQSGGSGTQRWCADVWIPIANAPIAIEIQHSYQHLRDYLRRQQRYEAAGVRCPWLVMEKHYRTLLDAMTKERYTKEFGRTWPQGQDGCLRELPVAMLGLDPAPCVRGPLLQAELPALLSAFASNKLQRAGGAWCIT